MAVTLEMLKDELEITWSQDDAKLTRKLNAAISIIERYTNHSLVSKTVTYISNGCPKEFYGAPILSIVGATSTFYHDLYVSINANLGEEVRIELGESDEANLDEAVIRLASTIFEDGEVNEVTLPLDLQIMVNQFRRDSFLD